MHLDHSIITGYELAVLHYYIYIYTVISKYEMLEKMQSKGSFKWMWNQNWHLYMLLQHGIQRKKSAFDSTF